MRLAAGQLAARAGAQIDHPEVGLRHTADARVDLDGPKAMRSPSAETAAPQMAPTPSETRRASLPSSAALESCIDVQSPVA
jgi:hypothetical protein